VPLAPLLRELPAAVRAVQDDLTAGLAHVLWLGGGPGTGKTTAAKRISRRHGLRWYNADARTWEHRDRALAAGNPRAIRWEGMTPEERWVTSTPAEMLAVSIDFERWPMIAADLRELPDSPLVLAEGTTVVPQLVAAGVADPSRSLWLSLAPALLQARLEARGTAPNAVELYVLTADEIERKARELGVPILRVDDLASAHETVAAVEAAFADALAAGPRAESADERRALLRHANEAFVAQCHTYLARPWTSGEPETFVRPFVCECDEGECDGIVEIAVAEFVHRAAGGPVLAH
jgi:broad-specificity NMP kinase